MIPSRSRRTLGAAAALAQTAAGLVAHVGASGCLPSARSLALAVPLALVAVLGVQLLRPRLVAVLAGGQLAVHLVLAVVAACTGGVHAHAHSGSSLVMTAAHVAALAVCGAALGHVEAVAARVVAALARLVRLPAPGVRVPVPAAAPVAVLAAARPPRRDVLLSAPRRGPPGGRLVAVPA